MKRKKIAKTAVLVFFGGLMLLGLLIDVPKWFGPEGLVLKRVLNTWIWCGALSFCAYVSTRVIESIEG